MASDDPFRRFKSEREFRKNFNAKLSNAAQNAQGDYFEPGFYGKLREDSRKWQDAIRDYSSAAVLVPVGLWSFSESFSFPDSDISILGIGNHRFFLFHSGAAAWIVKTVYEANFGPPKENEAFGTRVWRKVLGVAAASSVFAIGCHLTIDALQPKSVIFPGVGSLINGTLIDDNIWLLGNAFYCFKVADDIYALALGEDYERVKDFIKYRFIRPLKEGGARDVPVWN